MDEHIEEVITKMFRDFEEAESLVNPYSNSYKIGPVDFEVVKKGKVDYDYDTESESGDFHVYKASYNEQECFVKIQIFYTSYGGLRVTGYAFVKPSKKLVTVFE